MEGHFRTIHTDDLKLGQPAVDEYGRPNLDKLKNKPSLKDIFTKSDIFDYIHNEPQYYMDNIIKLGSI